MPMTREKKCEQEKALTDVFKRSASAVFVNFRGLSVSDANTLRTALRESGVSYMVVKKTLTRRALDTAAPEGERPALEGELAIAWGDDYVAPAREIKRFQKDLDGAVNIMGGIFDGRYMSRDEMESIASIPPLETLYGQVANVINSPIQGLVVALGQIAESKN